VVHTFLSQVHKVASAVSKRRKRREEKRREREKKALVIKGKAVQPGARLSECNHPMVKQLSSMLMRFPCKVVSINQAFGDLE
jgi:hypothetical protein